MTDDELIALAREAGASRYTNRHYPDRPTHTFNLGSLHRFVRLVLAKLTAQEPVAYVAPVFIEEVKESGEAEFVTLFARNTEGVEPLYTRPQPAVVQVPQKYDDVLLPFLSLMRRELHANSGKGDRQGWLSMDANTALLEVYYHLSKLQKAVRDNEGLGIQEYAADVANMAMMVLDVCGGIPAPEAPAQLDSLGGGE